MRMIVILVLSLIAADVVAQKTAEPPFKWKVYYLDQETLIPLEALPYTKRLKGGLSKNKSLVEVKGGKSLIRFHEAPIFCVKVADSELDPDTQLTLYRMESDTRHRNTILKSVGALSQRTELSNGELLKFARYGDNCLAMKVESPLPPGEYGFFLPFSTQLFLFGVD